MNSTPDCPAALLLDFDGVLVDTERHVLEELARALTLLRPELDCTSIDTRFRGRDLDLCLDELDHLAGRPNPVGFVAQVRRDALNGSRPIRPEPGARRLLSDTRFSWRIVSNSPATRVREHLSRVGLGALVPEYALITADRVGASKPDPRLYLAAAANADVEPRQCLAVEDSAVGAAAARAANVPVIGYAPDHARRCALATLGIPLISHLGQIEDVMAPSHREQPQCSGHATTSASS